MSKELTIEEAIIAQANKAINAMSVLIFLLPESEDRVKVDNALGVLIPYTKKST